MALMSVLAGTPAAHAQSVILSGDTDPFDPGNIDAGSDLSIGYGATGSMTVAGGAQVVSAAGGLGVDTDGDGTALLTGDGSTWQITGRLNVGLWGTGHLRIENGATISSNDGIVGGNNAGDAIVTGGGTRWDNAGQFTVGSYGPGTLRIEAGATVTSNQGYVGAGPDSIGSVTVTGAGSAWVVTAYNITLGNFGTGSLTIADGGLVRAPRGVDLGGSAVDASGTLILQGVANNLAVLETSGMSAGLGAASVSIDGGLLRATDGNDNFFRNFGTRDIALGANGAVIDTNGYDIGVSPRLAGAGALTKEGGGILTLTGDNAYAGATIVRAGVLRINGDQSAATGLTTVRDGATLGGSGIIGGNVVIDDGAMLAPGNSPGTLTINGDLSLAGGSVSSFELGQANSVGGALNDLVNVGGDLILDGTLDVTVPAGGSFGAGIYRIYNYAGTLTDNGLELGTIPAGSHAFVQTSVANQVNLVNTNSQFLTYWDGAAGPKFDGAINGGNGIWQNRIGNDNWTDAHGLANASFSDGAFAVFGATGGTVTVDNSLGQVSVAGMQFAADGYVIAGQPIALVDPQTTIRVGDGSTAGAGFTATINAVIAGDAQLVKADTGTLVLGGDNSFTGGIAVNGGTVQIAGDANLGAVSGGVILANGTLAASASIASNRTVTLADMGTISTADGTTFTLTGQIAGTGALAKAGSGTLLITGDNAGYRAGTTIIGGTLAVTGALGGAVAVTGGTRLEGTGRVGAVANAGTVAPGHNGFGTLTTGDYSGADGTLVIKTVLGGDNSQTDRLAVNGATAGTTTVNVVNRGGLGAQTVDGIRIIDVAGTSDGAFVLKGDYIFQGDHAIIAGAYGYRLYKGGASTPSDGDWYLRSTLRPGQPSTPLYQPGVPVYEAYGQTLLSLIELGTLQQRLGDRQRLETLNGKPSGIWGRIDTKFARPNALRSTSGADVDTNSWKAEIGVDRVLSERSDGSMLVAGVIGSYGWAKASIGSIFGNGSVKARAYGAGATLSWFGPHGFTIDGRAQFTWFDSALKSSLLGELAGNNKGTGQAYSVEIGKRTPVGGNLSVTPQIQMVYSTVGFNGFTDPNGAIISADQGDSLKTRWGLSIDRQGDRSHFYLVSNLSYEWLDGTVTYVSGTPIARSQDHLWGELGIGGSLLLGDRVTLYSEASTTTALRDFGGGYGLRGVIGLRMGF